MTRLHVPVALRWADLDAYAHVNNVDMFRLLEEARIAAFWVHPDVDLDDPWPTAVLEAGAHADVHTVVARQEIEYLRPLGFTRTPIRIEMWIGHLGGASLDVCYEVHDGAGRFPRTGPGSGGQPYARAAATIVLVDAVSGAPKRIGDSQRAAWEPFIEPPLRFRRHS